MQSLQFKDVQNGTIYILQEEDNLSIVDEMTSPNVSFVRRFHYWSQNIYVAV